MTFTQFMLLMLIGIGSATAAPDESADEQGLKPLYFRVETDRNGIHSMVVRIDSSTEKGEIYDRVTADTDGDGKYEKALDVEFDGPPDDDDSEMLLRFPLGGLEWRLDLMGPFCGSFAGKVYFHWTYIDEEIFVWFINGTASLHASAAQAAEAQAIHLGPPFHYDVQTSTRGPNALFNVGLVDKNGATMRMASTRKTETREGSELNITVTFSQESEKRSSIVAEYG